MVERLNGIQEVAGSTPTISTKKISTIRRDFFLVEKDSRGQTIAAEGGVERVSAPNYIMKTFGVDEVDNNSLHARILNLGFNKNIAMKRRRDGA